MVERYNEVIAIELHQHVRLNVKRFKVETREVVKHIAGHLHHRIDDALERKQIDEMTWSRLHDQIGTAYLVAMGIMSSST